MPFSWTNAKKRTIDKRIERAITMAKAGTNADFKLRHADWVREAQKGNYTDLKVKVRKETEDRQAVAQRRREKLGGK